MNHSVQYSSGNSASENNSPIPQNTYLHKKFLEILQRHSEVNPDQAFYLQYCKMYIQVINKQKQIVRMMEEIKEIKGHLQEYPSKFRRNLTPQVSQQGSNAQRKKRIRRTANQIARHYVCKVEKCQKSYGSQGSLNQHIKLKHKQLIGILGIASQNSA